jgi:hypothetical protein
MRPFVGPSATKVPELAQVFGPLIVFRPGFWGELEVPIFGDQLLRSGGFISALRSARRRSSIARSASACSSCSLVDVFSFCLASAKIFLNLPDVFPGQCRQHLIAEREGLPSSLVELLQPRAGTPYS